MRDTSAPARRLATHVFGLLGVLAFAGSLLAVSGCFAESSMPPSATETVPATEATQSVAGSEDSGDVVEGAVGEPISTETFTITVTQATPTDLPKTSAVLQERTNAVAVNVRMANASGADVPLNALPYSVYNTVLRAGSTDYPGSLVSNFANDTRDGVVAKGVTLNLNFVYEYPAEVEDARFVWAPAPTAAGYPTIVVPLPAEALAPE